MQSVTKIFGQDILTEVTDRSIGIMMVTPPLINYLSLATYDMN